MVCCFSSSGWDEHLEEPHKLERLWLDARLLLCRGSLPSYWSMQPGLELIRVASFYCYGHRQEVEGHYCFTSVWIGWFIDVKWGEYGCFSLCAGLLFGLAGILCHVGVDVNRALIIPKLKIITKACVLYDRQGERIGKGVWPNEEFSHVQLGLASGELWALDMQLHSFMIYSSIGFLND